MSVQDSYDELIRLSREESLLGSCTALLDWDEQTYVPAKGGEHRSNQKALLAGIQHEKSVDPKVGELLDELEDSELARDPESASAVNIRERRRSFRRLSRLPKSLIEELARTTSAAHGEWVGARQEADFSRFCPWLEKVVARKREMAECLIDTDAGTDGQNKGIALYDALLDEFEPRAKTAEIARLFADLRKELVPLVASIADSSTQPDRAFLRRDYPLDRQKIFAEAVSGAIGFDFERGRTDVAAHPFCTGVGPGDCRITTKYDPRNFSVALFSILHETGHALYEQGLDPEHYGTPIGQWVSLGVHESQSRLWENSVGRSRPFWEHFFPIARQVFRESLHDVEFDNFYFAMNHVEPSPIRVKADEVTYDLHVLIRFELEQALISGDLAAADLPGAWTEKYQKYLDVTPKDDAEGCLQDVHWSAGLFGYFPTYTLGNLFAAQLFAKANEELGGLDKAFARGEFSQLLDWLRTKIHHQGQRYPATTLIERASGSSLDHRPLIEAHRRKYGALYNF
jgi:carboxypeptidase Taq